tara:strand:+ start:195 stop:932 length:738 start_codon:yes stop_codon:yes gene_type:complete
MNNILDIEVDVGETIRTDCPICKGHNTFTITNDMGKMKWNCYKASCSVKGNQKTKLSVSQLMRKKEQEKDFTIPEYIVPHRNRGHVLDFLHRWGITNAIGGILYDVREDRVVFPVMYDGTLVDATGRALAGWRQPKWRRYGFSPFPYQFGQGNVAVVVEDCVSAVVAGSVTNFVGVALLGTNLLDTHKQILSQFSTVLVALDPDAITKASSMVKDIPNSKLLNLKNDLKYQVKDDIDMMIRLGGV